MSDRPDQRVTSRPPAGYHTVTPRIFVDDPGRLHSFLRAVFDATGDPPHRDRPAEVRIGDSLLIVSSTSAREPFPAFLYVYVDDADRVYERAVAAGAETIEAPVDIPYGDRRATVRDGFGNIFQIAHRRRSGPR